MLTDLCDTDAIRSAVDRLQAYNPTSLIVDLRLCNRGTIDDACEVATMISNVSGTFLRTIWNTSKSANNRDYSLTGTASFQNLYFITSGYTQGAAEWLIHGLSALMGDNLTIVGQATAGQNVMLQAVSTPYQFTLYPAVAFVADVVNNADYSSGLQPDSVVNEFDYALLYPYGDEREVLVNQILTNY